MKILVAAATRAELSGLYAAFGFPETDFVQTPEFDVLITGVGMTATAFALGQHLPGNYSMVLNLGIAGCYNRDIPLGTLLNITADEFSELGAEDNDSFLTIDDLGFGRSKYTAQYKHNPALSAFSTFSDSLEKVNGITVNKVHGNSLSIADIVRRLNPVTESMEGAAVFYCCAQTGTPCLQIRSISNYVEVRNRDNWKIGLALNNLNNWAINFLTNH